MNTSLNHEISDTALGSARIPPPHLGARPELSLDDVWRVLRKRRLIVLVCCAVSIGLAILVSKMTPPRYEAVARVVFTPENSNALGLTPMDAMSGGVANDIVQQTQVRILESDPLAWDVIRKLKLDQRSDFVAALATQPGESLDSGRRRAILLAKFRRTLRVQSVPKTQVIEVRYRDGDPRLAADVANTLTNAYIERNFRRRYEATRLASDWLSKQLDDLKTNVQETAQRFADYQKNSGIIGTSKTDNIFTSQLEESYRQMALAQTQRITREAIYRIAESGNPELLAQVVPTQVAPNSPLLIRQAQLAELKKQYAELSTKYGDSYPRVAQVRTQIAEVEGGIASEIKGIRERFKKEYEASLQAEQMLGAHLEKQKLEAYRMNEAGIQFAVLKRDAESTRDLYEGLQKKLKEAGIVAGLQSTSVDIIQPAEVPIKPAEPRTGLNLVIGTLFGLLSGVTLAFIFDNIDRRIDGPHQVEILGEFALLGVVPEFESRNGFRRQKPPLNGARKLSVLDHPESQFAEAYRGLRTNLLLSAPGAPPKTIVVTSSVSGEGKTTTSINCAMVLAQTQRRVLLVDGDLRRSGLNTNLNLRPTIGLSSCLSGGSDVADAVISLPDLPSLDILPAGPRPPNPAELLDSAQMRELLRRCGERYDHVIVDTPPLLAVTDGLVLATMANAVLLVARCGQTEQQSLLRSCNKLWSVNAHFIGVVLNCLKANSLGYYYYYGHYGSKYSNYYTEIEKN